MLHSIHEITSNFTDHQEETDEIPALLDVQEAPDLEVAGVEAEAAEVADGLLPNVAFSCPTFLSK